MSKTFYVTLSKSVATELQITPHEVVHADHVEVHPTGALIFTNHLMLSSDKAPCHTVAVAYAPGTWVLFSEEPAE